MVNQVMEVIIIGTDSIINKSLTVNLKMKVRLNYLQLI